MGVSSDYPRVPEWVAKPEGYQTGAVTKYKGNIFRAAFWASEPGAGDANTNGWRFFDELYDQTPHKPTEQAKIIAYIPTWRKADDFDYGNGEMYQYITHGIIAFLTFSQTDVGAFDPASVAEVTAILPDVIVAASLSGTRMMVALGGANDYAFLDLMTRVGNDPATPQLDQAVSHVVDFVAEHDLDGVDLDLECWWGRPGEPDQGGRTKADGPHPAGRGLALFAQKLKQAMPGKIVSATVFGTSWYGNNYDPKMADHVDWLGVMTYDFTGSWDRSPVGPHTALLKIRGKDTSSVRRSDVYQESYLPEQQGGWPSPSAAGGPPASDADNIENNPITSLEDSLWYWTNPLFVNWQGTGQGVARDKIAAGVPVYGYDFAAAKAPDDMTGQVPPGYKVLRYKEILAAYPDAAQAEHANIKVSGSTPRPVLKDPLPPGTYPYAHNIYFETPDTAVTKLKFLKDVGAQGVIIWELSNDVWDDGKSIIKALYGASGNPQPSPVTQPPEVVASHCLWDSTGFLGESKDNLQFQDDGIVRDGVRQFAARLWNIPDGDDWVTTAKRSPAVIRRQYFNRPTRIVDKGALGLWGEFDVLETDVPAWYWGHMEAMDGSPAGFTRYRSRLWGLSLSDDWQAAAKQTPALIEGYYFDQPTQIEDGGINGLYGIFDVSTEQASSPRLVAQSVGPNDCSCCLIDTLPPQGGNVTLSNLTTTMTVNDGTPFLYAVLTRAADSAEFPHGVVMTLRDPDGNAYDHEVTDDNQFVRMSGSSIRCLVVRNPKPGDWTMGMTVPKDATFHCECDTVPNADVFDSMVKTWQQLTSLQDIEPRDIGGAEIAALLGVVAIMFIAPEVEVVTAALSLAVFTVGWYGSPIEKTVSGAARTMASVAGIVTKIAKDILKEGYPAVQKYKDLIGKHITDEECDVIRRHPTSAVQWIGTHKDVYQAVEHMTDPEEQNAVRHVYWQCLLTRRLGKDFAKEMADAHERAVPGTPADNQADEKNNLKGRELAAQVDSDQACLDRAKEMWAAHELATRVELEADPT